MFNVLIETRGYVSVVHVFELWMVCECPTRSIQYFVAKNATFEENRFGICVQSVGERQLSLS